MKKDKPPLLSDDFLDELAKEINAIYGEPNDEEQQDNKSTI